MACQVLLWVIIAGRTVIGAWRGNLVVAPCLSGLGADGHHDGAVTAIEHGNGDRNEPASRGKDSPP